MKVSEMIKVLQAMPQDATIQISLNTPFDKVFCRGNKFTIKSCTLPNTDRKRVEIEGVGDAIPK